MKKLILFGFIVALATVGCAQKASEKEIPVSAKTGCYVLYDAEFNGNGLPYDASGTFIKEAKSYE